MSWHLIQNCPLFLRGCVCDSMLIFVSIWSNQTCGGIIIWRFHKFFSAAVLWAMALVTLRFGSFPFVSQFNCWRDSNQGYLEVDFTAAVEAEGIVTHEQHSTAAQLASHTLVCRWRKRRRKHHPSPRSSMCWKLEPHECDSLFNSRSSWCFLSPFTLDMKVLYENSK